MATESNEPQANNTSTAEGNGSQKVTFTDEQQAKVEQIVDRAVGRVASNLRTELSAKEQKIADLEAELNKARDNRNSHTPKGEKRVEDLEATIEEMKRASHTSKEEAERYKAEAQARAKEVEVAKRESVSIRKSQVIQNAAAKHNFVSLEAVGKLTQDNIDYDQESGRFVVLNEYGKTRLNAAMEPMTIEEFYQDFASKNKYLVRGDFQSGTGSTESMRQTLTKTGQYEVTDLFGPKSNAKLANDLALKDKVEYRRMRAIAIQSGLVAK